MGVIRYTVEGASSRVRVVARSSIHDIEAALGPITGTIEADLDDLADHGAVALSLEVDLTEADGGDPLRTRKLRGDIDVRRYPRASFSLSRVVSIARDDAGAFEAQGAGVLSWRDQQLEIEPSGRGTLTADHLAAVATFRLDIREFGVKPPKFLMLKVEPEVLVEVTLVAGAQ